MDGGFIKIYRSLFSNPIWTANEPFDIRSAWIDMIQRAAFNTTFVIKNRKSIPIEAGCFAASERELAADWHCTRACAREYISVFISMGCLSRFNFEGTTIYKLNSYAYFNGVSRGDPPNPQPIRNQSPTSSIYNIERRTKEFTPPSPHRPQKKEEENGAGASPSACNGGHGACASQGGHGSACAECNGQNGGCSAPVQGLRPESGNGNCGASAPAPASGAPTLDEWSAYAVSIGWEYSEEYQNCWKHFQTTRNRRGEWRDKNGLTISDWKLHCQLMRDFWAGKMGRRRANFRTIAECLGDDAEPIHWRQEYAAQFKMANVDDVAKWYVSFADLKERNFSLATLILTRCLKNHYEDRKQFRTEYRAEMADEKPSPRPITRACKKCGKTFTLQANEWSDGMCPWCAGVYGTPIDWEGAKR